MSNLAVVALGGGCFWCTEAVFVRVKGVLDVESGYCNGQHPNPSYEDVCTGTTGHAEVVRLTYDPEVIGLKQLLQIFFAVHDPTTPNRQGHDVGTQYRSGVYFTELGQQTVACELIAQLEAEQVFDAPIVTEVAPLSNYHAAEEYHQDFFEKNPYQGYCLAVAAPKVAKLKKVFAEWVK